MLSLLGDKAKAACLKVLPFSYYVDNPRAPINEMGNLLHYVTQFGSIEAMKLILKTLHDENRTACLSNLTITSFLHYVSQVDEQQAKVELGNNPDLKGGYFYVIATPLHHAVQTGNIEKLRLILEVIGEDALSAFSLRDNFGKTPLHCAARTTNPEMILEILNFLGSDKGKMCALLDKNNLLPIHYAHDCKDNFVNIFNAMKEHDQRRLIFKYNTVTTLSDKAVELGCKELRDSYVSLYKDVVKIGYPFGMELNMAYRTTLLHKAIELGCLDLVEKIFKIVSNTICTIQVANTKEVTAPASVGLCMTFDHYNRTPLHLAALIGDIKICKRLLTELDQSKLYEHMVLYSYPDSSGNTPLHYAARSGNLEIFSLILSKMAPDKDALTIKSACSKGNNRGETVLHFAAQAYKGNILSTIIDLLGDAKLVCNQLDSRNQSVFHQAVAFSNIEKIRMLIKLLGNDAIPLCRQLTVDYHSPLHAAIYRITESKFDNTSDAAFEILNLLDGSLEDIGRYQDNESGDNLIHSVAEIGRIELLEKILSRLSTKAEWICAQQNHNGNTPLHSAVLSGRLDVVTKILTALGSDAKRVCLLPNFEGENPIDLAILSSELEILDKLLMVVRPKEASDYIEFKIGQRLDSLRVLGKLWQCFVRVRKFDEENATKEIMTFALKFATSFISANGHIPSSVSAISTISNLELTITDWLTDAKFFSLPCSLEKDSGARPFFG